MINYDIFKACDIRGVYQEQLTEEAARQVGLAVASEIAGRPVLVGGDVRVSTPSIKDALIDGLRDGGSGVTDLGIIPTPVVYFARKFLAVDDVLMVTASHNPPQYNGIKLMLGGQPTIPEGMARLVERIREQDYSEGAGELNMADDILGAYREWLVTRFQDAFPRPLHVLVDAGSGCYGEVAPAVFEALGHQVTRVFCDIDGRFPHRSPNPADFRNLSEARTRAAEANIDLAVAFDGDGDRVVFLDDTGAPLESDRIAIVLARHLLAQNPGGGVVFDLKCSDLLRKEIETAGGVPHMERSGHSFIRSRMMREGACFGAEISGHIFFEELDYGDDGLFSALQVAALVSQDAGAIRGLMASVPTPVITPDVRVKVSGAQRDSVLADFEAAFNHIPTSRIDGVRVDWPQGWALCRPSVTEPVVTLRFEADSEAALRGIVQQVATAVPLLADALQPWR